MWCYWQPGENRIFIFVSTAPALILLAIFMIVPTIEVFRMSLYKWGGFSNSKVFVGFDNFKILWNDMTFFRSLQNFIFGVYFLVY